MQKPPVDFDIHQAVLKDRDRLQRENSQLKYANQLLEVTLANERKSMPLVIKREAERRARDLVFVAVHEKQGTA